MSEQQDPSLPQSAPLPGTTGAGPSQPQQADQAAVPGEPQTDAGTPNSYQKSPQPQPGDGGQGAGGSTPITQPDPWTITDTPSPEGTPAPDETVQPADSESGQE